MWVYVVVMSVDILLPSFSLAWGASAGAVCVPGSISKILPLMFDGSVLFVLSSVCLSLSLESMNPPVLSTYHSLPMHIGLMTDIILTMATGF